MKKIMISACLCMSLFAVNDNYMEGNKNHEHERQEIRSQEGQRPDGIRQESNYQNKIDHREQRQGQPTMQQDKSHINNAGVAFDASLYMPDHLKEHKQGMGQRHMHPPRH